MNYELCATCKKPLINEHNLKIFRIKFGVYVGAASVGGGILGACMLPLLGFGFGGVISGSLAASWQGPAVVAGSWFAICQSLGATGMGILLFGATGVAAGAAGGAGALGLIYKYRKKFDWCCCD